MTRQRKHRKSKIELEDNDNADNDNADNDDAAPEGVAAFIRTPPKLAHFIHDLLHGSTDPSVRFINNISPGPPEPDAFYLMPCVGDGAIPRAWLEAGKQIGRGGVFCELFPNSLRALAQALCADDWSWTAACNGDEWSRRLMIAEKVCAHLDKRNQLEKTREPIKRLDINSEATKAEFLKVIAESREAEILALFSENDRTRIVELIAEIKKAESSSSTADGEEARLLELIAEIKDAKIWNLTAAINKNKQDPHNNDLERYLATPIYYGCLTKGSASIFLFQGSATQLFEGRNEASKKLDEILLQHNRYRIVAVENLPWGATSFLKETANQANIQIMSAVLTRTSPGSRSAFIINRAGIVANTTSLVPTRIAKLWNHGTILRIFPLPTQTFQGHNMAMACLFVFRRFTEHEQVYHDSVVKLMNMTSREAMAPLRYFCGLLSGEDMAWGQLMKKATQKASRPSTFAESAIDYQNRILSDGADVIHRSGKAQNPDIRNKYLIQVSGELADQLVNRLQEEAFTQLGERTLEAMYNTYRKKVLRIVGHDKFITIKSLESCTDRSAVIQCQTALLDALCAMTSRELNDNGEGSGNIVFQRRRFRSTPEFGHDVVAAHEEIMRRIRLVVLVHRVLVPSFVLENLAFLYVKFVQRLDKNDLAQKLTALYESGMEAAIAFLRRRCEAPTDGQFLG